MKISPNSLENLLSNKINRFSSKQISSLLLVTIKVSKAAAFREMKLINFNMIHNLINPCNRVNKSNFS